MRSLESWGPARVGPRGGATSNLFYLLFRGTPAATEGKRRPLLAAPAVRGSEIQEQREMR